MTTAPATVAIPGYLAGTWKADPANSQIAFSVRQLMVTKVRGRFTSYDVTIVTSEDPHGSSVVATIDLASIDTGNMKRDDHLRVRHLPRESRSTRPSTHPLHRHPPGRRRLGHRR